MVCWANHYPFNQSIGLPVIVISLSRRNSSIKVCYTAYRRSKHMCTCTWLWGAQIDMHAYIHAQTQLVSQLPCAVNLQYGIHIPCALFLSEQVVRAILTITPILNRWYCPNYCNTMSLLLPATSTGTFLSFLFCCWSIKDTAPIASWVARGIQNGWWALTQEWMLTGQ